MKTTGNYSEGYSDGVESQLEKINLIKEQFSDLKRQNLDLQEKLGLTEIELNHKNTLLESCEKALTETQEKLAESKNAVDSENEKIFNNLIDFGFKIVVMPSPMQKDGTAYLFMSPNDYYNYQKKLNLKK